MINTYIANVANVSRNLYNVMKKNPKTSIAITGSVVALACIAFSHYLSAREKAADLSMCNYCISYLRYDLPPDMSMLENSRTYSRPWNFKIARDCEIFLDNFYQKYNSPAYRHYNSLACLIG